MHSSPGYQPILYPFQDSSKPICPKTQRDSILRKSAPGLITKNRRPTRGSCWNEEHQTPTLVKLQNEAQKAWLDGCKSVSDPRYNDGRDRLPFYAITFWRQIRPHIEHQAKWKEASKWVTERHTELIRTEGKENPVRSHGVFESLATMTIGAKHSIAMGCCSCPWPRRLLGQGMDGIDCMDLMMDRVREDPSKRG